MTITIEIRVDLDRLNELREERNLSQQALAAVAGVNQGNLSRILAGKQTPSLTTAKRLARALDTTLDDICAEAVAA